MKLRLSVQASLRTIAKFLKETPELDFNFLMDLTAVDYLFFAGGRIQKESRFEVVYHFFSLKYNHRIRIKVPVDEKIPKWTRLWVFGLRPTGMNGKFGTCTASGLKGTLI